MLFRQSIECTAELSAVLIRKDGTRINIGVLKPTLMQRLRLLRRQTWRALTSPRLLAKIGLALALLSSSTLMLGGLALGLVTTAGVNYMATDFASGGVTPTISGFKFHASGTGTTAAAVGDTALQTDSGVARVTGTPTNPTANQYRSVATMSYVSTLAITEWGLFSASTVGTLWDHRVFSAVNVVSGDSIQFTYTLTVNNGGT